MIGSTWTWIGATSDPNLSTNWSPAGHPQSGDTAIIPGGTTVPPLLLDQTLSSNTLDLLGNGTIDFSNNTTAASNSGIDSLSVIDATGTATTLSVAGPFSNAGTIEVTGTHASLAISLTAGSAAPGWLTNTGQIIVAQGDTLAINGGTLFDSGAVHVNSGSVSIASALSGLGNFAVGTGGTLELNQAARAAFTDITFTGTTGRGRVPDRVGRAWGDGDYVLMTIGGRDRQPRRAVGVESALAVPRGQMRTCVSALY